MPGRRKPDSALIIIDMINALDFPGGAGLLRQALPAARRIARLKRRLKAKSIPAIYVNDNFTQWREDFGQLVAICAQDNVLGAPLARMLPPEEDDYVILKPQHSAFYNTPLEVLLRQLGVSRVILSGIAGDSCVLASTFDARMRGFVPVVPQDCTASNTAARNRNAIAVMRAMQVEVKNSARL